MRVEGVVKIGSFAIRFILKSCSNESSLMLVAPSCGLLFTFIVIAGKASFVFFVSGEIPDGLVDGLELDKLGSNKGAFRGVLKLWF